MSQYPECEKLAAVSKDSGNIREFLEWLLYSKNYVLAFYSDEDDYEYDNGLRAVNLNIEEFLAEYFEIDLDKVETERREILDSCRRILDERDASGS